ncbi:aminotransferase [Dichomitus squalens]|uniref:Aminotransferase n=1 Tax=Dichomitus squalens TaxID=114155 RepID=A0A4Q9PL97_9APHY|nr:aminotransferase [Dichomitus squalens]
MSATNFDLVSTTRRDPQLLRVEWNTAANSGATSPYLLLAYHHDRLRDAAEHHNWSVPQDFSVSKLEDLCGAALTNARVGSRDLVANDLASDEHYRIRILLSAGGFLSVTASRTLPIPIPDPLAPSLWLPTAPSPDPPDFGLALLAIHLDTIATPSSVFTRTKTTHRDHYNAARSRFGIPPPPSPSSDEVLLFNENDDITETSIRNVAFARRSPLRWVTPASSTGCLPGVVRRWLLEHGRIVEANESELQKDGIVKGEYVLTFNGVEGCRLGQIQ